jgi:hypothetical protein
LDSPGTSSPAVGGVLEHGRRRHTWHDASLAGPPSVVQSVERPFGWKAGVRPVALSLTDGIALDQPALVQSHRLTSSDSGVDLSILFGTSVEGLWHLWLCDGWRRLLRPR